VRDGVDVKLLEQEQDYVLTKSPIVHKERGHAPAPVEMAVGAARATFDNELKREDSS